MKLVRKIITAIFILMMANIVYIGGLAPISLAALIAVGIIIEGLKVRDFYIDLIADLKNKGL